MQADGSGDAAGVEVSAGELDHLRQPPPRRLCRLERLVPGSPSTQHRLHSRLRLDEELRRLLARRPAERPTAASLRHRLAKPRGAEGLPNATRRSRQRDHRKLGAELDLYSSGRDRLRSAGPPPRGGLLRKIMERMYSRSAIEAGHQFADLHISKAEPSSASATSSSTPSIHAADAHRRGAAR